MPPVEDKAEESVTVGDTTFTKSQVKDMDDGEFEHAVTLATQQGTPQGDEQAEALYKLRGKKAPTEEVEASDKT